MHTILSVQAVGGITVFFLFCIIFIIVHVMKLARLGWLVQENKTENKKTTQPQPQPQPQHTEKEKTDQAKQPQSIYYIVERKKRSPKRTYQYEEPKPIRFE